MKQKSAIIGLGLFLPCLFSAGCATAPMTYSEWKKEQAERAKFTAAGIPYKSPSQLRDEAAEMRRLMEQTVFPKGRK